jgi:asparagine synthase (glutamine-hydrolysing)
MGQNGVTKHSYFDAQEWMAQGSMGKSEFLDEFHRTFKALLPRYFNSAAPLGMSVTGGFDSRMILSCLDLEPGQLPCYTFGGLAGETYDVRIGRAVAQSCGQRHSLIRLDGSFLAGFPRYAERTVLLAEGCHDALGAHDLFFNERARTIAPIRMSGKFGSEIVRGSRHFKTSPPLSSLFDPGFHAFVTQARDTLAAMDSGDPLSFAAFVEIPLHEYGRLAIEQSQLTFGTPYTDNELVALMYRGRQLDWSDDDIPAHVIAAEAPELLRIRTDRGHRQGQSRPARWLADLFFWRLLYKADWVFNNEPSRYARPISLMRALHLDTVFMGRHIFSRYGRWLQAELAGYTKAVLLDGRTLTRPYLNGKALERMVLDHITGRRSHVVEINKALTIELVQRLLVEAT